jgi:hypothetical protein
LAVDSGCSEPPAEREEEQVIYSAVNLWLKLTGAVNNTVFLHRKYKNFLLSGYRFMIGYK